MRRLSRGALMTLALLTVLLFTAGCPNKTSNQGPTIPGPQGGGPPNPGGGGGGGSSPIKEIMNKLTKGPGSLTTVIGRELETDPPPWETIQPQAKEFAQLAATMGQNEPPKGSKESWAKLAGAYARSADALASAAEARDRDAARAAHRELAGSCMACHREHRMMRPGGGP